MVVYLSPFVRAAVARNCAHSLTTSFSLMANWFREAFGFSEPKDFQSARDAFRVREVASDAVPPAAGPALELEAVATQRVFHVGPFEDISVAQLRARVADMTANAPADSPADSPAPAAGLSFSHLVAEAKSLHLQPSSAHGVFQVRVRVRVRVS